MFAQGFFRHIQFVFLDTFTYIEIDKIADLNVIMTKKKDIN